MPPPTFKRLDVRKLIAQGIEPFPEIRKRVDALKDGEGLAVIAPFLPSPLIEKLRGESFYSRVEPQPDGSWITFFWRETEVGQPAPWKSSSIAPSGSLPRKSAP